MTQLINIFSRILAIIQGDRLAVQFYTEQVYKSTKWTKASADLCITDISFLNASTAGTIYIGNIPLEPGAGKTFGCQWNEVNVTDYQIRIPSTVTNPLVIIDYKRIEKPAK